MDDDVLLVARAFDYAARMHAGQRRKGPGAEPYVHHLVEVAARLAAATDWSDRALVAAGLLHDCVEDTESTLADVEEGFGADIAGLVAEVSDDKSLPKDVRKRLQVERTPGKSARARMLKLADLTSNLCDLAVAPPVDWDLERQHAYVAWARAVAAGCRGVNPVLEAAFEAAWNEGRTRLGCGPEDAGDESGGSAPGA